MGDENGTEDILELEVDEQEIEIVLEDKSDLWDQMRSMIKMQRWTTQDDATLNILQEMDTCNTVFVVRKSDKVLLGAIMAIDNPDVVYGNVYVTREGYRSSGMGLQATFELINKMKPSLQYKPTLGRGVPEMIDKYAGPPFLADTMHELYSIEFENKQELLYFFPAPPQKHNFKVHRVRGMSASLWEETKDYDRFITGKDRSEFLERYYGVQFVEGVVLRNDTEGIKGMCSTVPTIDKNLYKVNPIYTNRLEYISLLLQGALEYVTDPTARFVVHVRTGSAGDWILNKCRAEGKELHLVGTTILVGLYRQAYTEKAQLPLMWAPTNSPAHYDG